MANFDVKGDDETWSGSDPVKGAARALDLFEAFATARAPLTLTDLAQRIGVPMSSCHALVRTLHARGYLYYLEHPKRIYPTKRLAAIAQSIARRDPVFEKLSPILARLAKATGETVIVGKMQGDKVIYLDVIEGTHTVRFTAAPGDMAPAHSSAIGKSTLGLVSDAELDRAIEKLKLSRVTDLTITDRDAFKADVIAGRERGYFVVRGETMDDVTGISIAQRIGEEIYGIGVAGPTSRLSDNETVYAASLREAIAAVARIDVELRGNA